MSTGSPGGGDICSRIGSSPLPPEGYLEDNPIRAGVCAGLDGLDTYSRKIVAYLACTEQEIPQSIVARHLGVGQPAVVAMLSKGQSLASQMGVGLND
jgi:hypothetical protein